jgi:hypothetical protein
MPRAKKKSAPKSTTPKINKSAWIRSQPATIKLSVAQVYTARSSAKKTKGKVGPKPEGKPGPKPKTATAKTVPVVKATDGLHGEFKRLVIKIGTVAAQNLLEELASVGL